MKRFTRDDNRHAELPNVFNVSLEIRQAALERAEVLLLETVLVRAAVELERAHGRHEHRGFRVEAAEAALDVEEFLGAEVGSESRFGDDDVRERQGRARREDAVAAVGDVAERAGVHERRPAFERLHEVRTDRVLEQQRHRAGRLQIGREHRFPIAPRRGADDDAPESLLEIGRSRRERDDGHHLARRNDDEAILAHHAVRDAAEPDHHVAERSIVHVDRARPRYAARVDSQRVALVQVVVEHRREQRMRARDRVEVTREVEVDVLHRNDLRVATTRCAAFHAEHRAETRLADA